MIILNTAFVMGQKVNVTVNPDQDFGKFQRYAWGENGIAPAQLPEEQKQTESWVVDAVNKELTKKGYTEDSQNPDFIVTVRALAYSGKRITSVDQNIMYNPWGTGVSSWVSLVAGVSIVITDKTTNTVAWEAALEKEYKDPDKLTNNVKKEIDKVFKKGLKKFPKYNK